MRTSVGIWDAIFGKRVTMEVPLPHGGVKLLRVTERWIAEMQRQGKMEPIGGQTVKANIMDPLGGFGDLFGFSEEQMGEVGLPVAHGIFRAEEWIIGRDISAEQYGRLKDPETGELFVFIGDRDGERRPLCVTREHWLQSKRVLESIRASGREPEDGR